VIDDELGFSLVFAVGS